VIDDDKKYFIGDIRLDGFPCSEEFLDFAEREKKGLATEAEIREWGGVGVPHSVITEKQRTQTRAWQIVRNVVGIMNAEGFNLTDENIKDIWRVASGQSTDDEVVAEIVKRYRHS